MGTTDNITRASRLLARLIIVALIGLLSLAIVAAIGLGAEAMYDDSEQHAAPRGLGAAGSDGPEQSARPTPDQARVLLKPGDHGPAVRELQARLVAIDWMADVTGVYDESTSTAVRGFQAKRGVAVTGTYDDVTERRLVAMTREPGPADLRSAADLLDARCKIAGRALCIDKSTRKLRFVVDGGIRATYDARFGSAELPTREGVFAIHTKSRHHVSKIYGSSMPSAMFFSAGQAVHYSSDFAARGYGGASHGCVNIRDEAGIAWLFDQVSVGDRVVVYWS
ncbi:MAG: L,D-transpeptidase family protein [Nocardioides sp.]